MSILQSILEDILQPVFTPIIGEEEAPPIVEGSFDFQDGVIFSFQDGTNFEFN